VLTIGDEEHASGFRETDHYRCDKSASHICYPHESIHTRVVWRLRINRPWVSVYPIRVAHTVSSNWFPTGTLVTVCWGVPGFFKSTSWEPP
jgi:hypothetical protein